MSERGPDLNCALIFVTSLKSNMLAVDGEYLLFFQINVTSFIVE